MEDNLQTMLIFLISIIILFIFPVYIAYEKKDDISYALVLSYTQSFVEEVRSKGYITHKDYSEYISMITSTGNAFDVKMEHKHKVVYPGDIVKCFGKDPSTGNETIDEKSLKEYNTMTQLDKDLFDNIVVLQETNVESYDTQYILNIITAQKPNSDPNIIEYYNYYMNTDDMFSITIKNRNATLATVMFNLVTMNSQDMNTRIYVNYAGQINDEKWYNDDVSYYISDTDIANKILNDKPPVFVYDTVSTINSSPATSLQGSFIIEIEINDAILNYRSSIKDLGHHTTPALTSFDGDFITGTNKNDLYVYLGGNGIMAIIKNTVGYDVVLVYPHLLIPSDKIKIFIKDDKPGDATVSNVNCSLYINDERVCFTDINIEGDVSLSNANIKNTGIIKSLKVYQADDT